MMLRLNLVVCFAMVVSMKLRRLRLCTTFPAQLRRRLQISSTSMYYGLVVLLGLMAVGGALAATDSLAAKACMQETNVSKALLDQVRATNHFPDDANLKQFVLCYGRRVRILAQDYQVAPMGPLTHQCQTPRGEDTLEDHAYKTVTCMYKLMNPIKH